MDRRDQWYAVLTVVLTLQHEFKSTMVTCVLRIVAELV